MMTRLSVVPFVVLSPVFSSMVLYGTTSSLFGILIETAFSIVKVKSPSYLGVICEPPNIV